ncbi:hypothetical protein H311_03451, partial [Anncaliia algerae PRA109]
HSRTLRDNVLKDSIIYSDSWKAYNNLYKYFKKHLKVNHTKHFKDPLTDVCTNTIGVNWSSLKLTIPKKHRSKDYISLYLVKYMITRNETGPFLINLIKYLFY